VKVPSADEGSFRAPHRVAESRIARRAKRIFFITVVFPQRYKNYANI
jgi:hypothetical protein